MRRALFVASVLASVGLVGCGDDEEETRTIAFLRAVEVAESSQDALLGELEAAGWVEGENLTVLAGDPSEAYEEPEDQEAAARRFVEEGADLIVALSSTSAIAAREATVDSDVAILFLVNDPMAAGLVTSEREPDANLTGTSFRVAPDRTLDVLTSLGGIEDVAVVAPADDPGATGAVAAFDRAADQLGLRTVEATFTDEGDAGEAVLEAVADGADALALVSSPATVLAFDAIEAAALEARVPAIANTATAEFAVIVLSPDSLEVYRQLGRQAARLLDGTPVRDVPVEDPAGFRLILRSGAADALGIVLPDELVARADDVEP